MTVMEADYSAVQSRPLRKAILEIAIFSSASLILTAALLATPITQVDDQEVLSRASVAGAAALNHIGTGLTAYAAIFLAFYGVVLTSQSGRNPLALPTQRFLGFTAELLTGALVPAFAIIGIACVNDPSLAGALFVLVPVFAFLLVVATLLGALIVFAPAEKLDSLKRSLTITGENLAKLQVKRRKHGVRIVVFNIFLFSLIGSLTTITSKGFGQPWEWYARIALVFTALTAILAIGCALGLVSIKTGSDRVNRASGYWVICAVYLAAAIIVLLLLLSSVPAAAVPVLAVATGVTVSSFWPNKWSRSFGRKISIREGADRIAFASLLNSETRIKHQRDYLEATSRRSQSC